MTPLKPKVDVVIEIGSLSELSRAELAVRWTSLFQTPPPKGIKRGLLERACAYYIQVEAFGGLGRSTRRAMLQGAVGKPVQSQRHGRTLRSGTRLVREWRGIVYQVEISDGCFVYSGREFRSLSAVAKAITGTAWSGPRFFGL
jgi:hypothetical protein